MTSVYDEVCEAERALQEARGNLRIVREMVGRECLTNAEAFGITGKFEREVARLQGQLNAALDALPLRNQIVFTLWKRDRARAAQVLEFPA